MGIQADKTSENKNIKNSVAQKQKVGKQKVGGSHFQFVDNRPQAIAQRKLQEIAKNSPRTKQLKSFQDLASNGPQAKQTTQLQSMAINHSAKQQQPIQKKENNTGLPDNLKTGMENLSGIALDDVKVHRNSDKPAQLNAHAYAQGADIHLGPGQEKHLPHEAWHVVQQKQGRVKPTMQMKGKVKVNDDAGLENEADVMGKRALSIESTAGLPSQIQLKEVENPSGTAQMMFEDPYLWMGVMVAGIAVTTTLIGSLINICGGKKEAAATLANASGTGATSATLGNAAAETNNEEESSNGNDDVESNTAAATASTQNLVPKDTVEEASEVDEGTVGSAEPELAKASNLEAPLLQAPQVHDEEADDGMGKSAEQELTKAQKKKLKIKRQKANKIARMKATAVLKQQEAEAADYAQQQAQQQAKQLLQAAQVAAANLAAQGPAELAILRGHMAGNSVLNAVKQKVKLKGNRNIAYNDRRLSAAQGAAAAAAWLAIPNQVYFRNFHIPGNMPEFASKWRAGEIEINLVLGCNFNNEPILIHLLPTQNLEGQMKKYHFNVVPNTNFNPLPLSQHG